MNHIPNLKYKTTLCLNWSQGLFCEKEDGCYFAHGQQELRTIEENRIAISQRNKTALQYQPTQNYKTIFCKFYGKGECKLGQACTYAHERREKKMKRSNTISYESENYYNLYAYYSQLNPWITPMQPYYQPAPSYQYSNNAEYDAVNEEMKMSVETAAEQRESPQIQKEVKSSEPQQKYELPISQDIQETFFVDLNSLC